MIPEAIREGDDDTLPGVAPVPLLAAQAPLTAAQERGIDLVLLGAVLSLLCIGTVEIYSASAVNAASRMGSSTYFLQRHLMYVGVGLAAMWGGARTDFSWLRRMTYPLLGAAFFLLIAVLFVGSRVGGAHPFLISWDGDDSPTHDSPPAGRLTALAAGDPDPGPAAELLTHLGVTVDVDESPTPWLRATIETATGTVELA